MRSKPLKARGRSPRGNHRLTSQPGNVEHDIVSKKGPRQLSQVMAIKKLKGDRIIYEAAAHNLRELAARHGSYKDIDLSRTHLNDILRGPHSARAVNIRANDLMKGAGIIKPRKNGVRGVEIVFSLPVDFPGDSSAFFEDAVGWAKVHYKVPLLLATTHRDQGQLHCHVILLPLVDGRMRGSYLVGNKHSLRTAQESFSDRVGKVHGLTYEPAAAATEGRPLHLNGGAILALVRQNPSLLDNEPVFEALARAIKPTTALLEAVQKTASPENPIGFDSCAKPDGKKPIGFDSHAMPDREKPIGFGTSAGEISMESLSCVGEVPGKGVVSKCKLTPRRTLRKRITTSAKTSWKQITSRAAD